MVISKPSQIKLSVSITKQGKRYVAYSPALDFVTSGRSETEARKRFAEGVLLFLEGLEEMGTTEEVLKSLGWERERKQWQPPKIVSHSSMSLRIPVAV
ncbi:MAG: hypothetical protein A3C84_02485 [Candidatus Ryanbacteria bacterium RIFCSPHIGHO2_02_FULL_48_12]|uniref:HicB-like antitoxin of toxin-antitoxin system domain-containing protein n=1 Tax=Candidatus Ryanbacteria bacterium RIFCSPHIGHO2_01_FULL_48_27 TaxID=1802115 RepID=A0A1G2G5Z8_9BACT|nr:MAG: hypothetical protein A2756_02085 [Candidatus Ryanbacteria bacterium RIFCSPHIGHO2_01_FULL_48_27]OGZ50174.1 MAG: hypothetical protein A3C84_02485 [Candidatus Ryanbacteria bacterium RIFCSPHIGHO2_02_FULL_48_12]